MPEYESLDWKTLPDKTQTGAVKHNSEKDLNQPFGRQTTHPEASEPAATMANDPLNKNSEPQAAAAVPDGIELDLTFGVPVEERPIWVDLYESLRDVFFPPKLPPLELTSTPIPVPDRMAVKPNPWAIGISTTVNIAIVAILLAIGVKKIIDTAKQKTVVTPIELTEFKPPKDNAPGGGGGMHDKMEAIKGKLPPRMQPIIQTPKIDLPPLPSIDVQKDIIIPDTPTLPDFGISNSTNVKLASGGTGTGMGLGNGHGNGLGDGSGGNYGGGLYKIGVGGVTAPVLIYHVDAEFSDEARRAKYQGVVLVNIIVDVQGNPQNPRVARSLGMGLDEKAIEAIKQYKFKPAMQFGKAVPVSMNVEINFHLY